MDTMLMQTVPMTNPIQIFKTGTHVAMNGAELTFSEADLVASAKAYDPALHEAPLVVGHPSTDAPAYGWVKSLDAANGALSAQPDQLDPAFSELVAAGRYKKISAAFYSPHSPGNPVPGVYYLRHVGFLGAQPPAVKGLAQVNFSESDGIVTFNEFDDVRIAGLFRSLREWIIGQFSKEQADAVLPADAVAQLEQSAQIELERALAEPIELAEQKIIPTIGDNMSDQDKQELLRLRAENEQLQRERAEFAERERKHKIDTAHAENLAFAESLIKDGRLLPVSKNVVVSLLDFMSGLDQLIEFSEAGATKPLLDAVKIDWLAKSPKLIEFGEQYQSGETLEYASAPTAEELAIAKQLGLEAQAVITQRGK
ncbi:MAG: peptidase [Methylomonas sp.]|nr:MAG: peptidase [Methylomonas sp.]